MPEDSEPQDTFWWRLVHLDPALLRGLVVALVLLLGGLGVSIATDVPDTVVTAIAAFLAIVQALWTRPAVTANARVVVAAPDPVNRPGRVVAGEAVTTATSDAILDAARSDG